MKKILSVAVATVVLGSASAGASVSDAEWNALKAQIDAMSERLNTLEAENKCTQEYQIS